MVTFKVSDKNPESVKRSTLLEEHQHYLEGLKEYREEGCYRVLQGTAWNKDEVCDRNNGFVHGIIDAYSHHHNLVIRPDDVWLAIAVQFGLYVNGNAEALRSIFVEHEGKKQLVVSQAATLESADYGKLASEMTLQLKQNVKDEQVCDWVLPNFSTTSKNDMVVGSVVLMATMKSYFEYKFTLVCGIPSVTLLGTTEDWEEIDRRVGELGKYGKQCEEWSTMLKKITKQFVESSKGRVDVGFWNKVCHHSGGGSGPSYISGWITAFSVFDREGKWQVLKYVGEYPRIEWDSVSPGYLTVDVKVDDNGKEYETLMFAGHIGYDIVEDGKGIAPKVAWAITLKDKNKVK